MSDDAKGWRMLLDYNLSQIYCKIHMNKPPMQRTMSKCAPSARNAPSAMVDSCLSDVKTLQIARSWNTHGPEHMRVSELDAESALRDLHVQFNTTVGKEHLWARHPILRQVMPDSVRALIVRIIGEAFRPEMPDEWLQNPHEWLSNFDIEAVLRQYEQANPHFLFLGVFPMDFQEPVPPQSRIGNPWVRNASRQTCISQVMCDFDAVHAWREGKRHVAFVLNKDRHDQPGSHWVCCNICLDPKRVKYGVYYYDSVALPMTPEVQRFAQRVKHDVEARLHVGVLFPGHA